MKLSQLIQGLPVISASSTVDPEIQSIEYDSRKVRPGSLFFALPGLHHDGEEFAMNAIRAGAVAVVAGRELDSLEVPVVEVAEPRKMMALMSDRYFGRPSTKLKLVGVTGTNGKTTTAFLVKHLMDSHSRLCGLLGTIRYSLGTEDMVATRTTPESTDIQQMLVGMLERGCKGCVMEVSSHALEQRRADALDFDVGVFTNLTQDHLDYHGTMEDYFAAKVRLFEILQARRDARAVINADDRFGHRLADRFGKKLHVLRYGLTPTADFRAKSIRFEHSGTSFGLVAKGKEYLVRLPLIGLFNVYNSLAALASTAALGLEVRALVAALAEAPQVPGRLQRVPAKRNFQVYVDYAHTPDALENVLRTLRELIPNRIITVFGCGGDRDKGKRPLMGRAAESLSDYVILTSDNPRTEDPEAILRDVREGFRGNAYESIVDRTEAIYRAISLAEGGDILLIAGKGHETYQEIGGVRIPFDDVSVTRNAISEKEVVLE